MMLSLAASRKTSRGLLISSPLKANIRFNVFQVSSRRYTQSVE